MASVPIKEYLFNEVIASLKEEPLISMLNTDGDLEGVYPAERLDILDGYDSIVTPCAFVFMPEISGIESFRNFNRAEFTLRVYLFFPQSDNIEADTDCSSLISAVMECLSNASYSSRMRRVGGYRNGATLGEAGWVARGQDKGYQLSVSYTLTFPKSGFVDD